MDNARMQLPQPDDVVGGKYTVVRVLGQGAMGVVYEAIHLKLGTKVAIKVLLPNADRSPQSSILRFEREARAAAQLESPFIARVLDVDSLPSGLPYMVIEYLEGHDLSRELDARGYLPLEEAIEYVIQSCDAMTVAHQAGIIHRDLKPANLFLTTGTDHQVIKVLDFGISKLLIEQAENVTNSRVSLGTPAYMSPEQIRSPKDVDSRSDIWSLGVILYELLTGHLPFSGQTTVDIIASIIHTAPIPIRFFRDDLPEALETVLITALAKNPFDRYQTMEEFKQALDPWLPPPTQRMSSAHPRSDTEPRTIRAGSTSGSQRRIAIHPGGIRIGEIIADRFEVQALAASGGMGLVYRAKDRSNQQMVALKLLASRGGQPAERSLREAQTLAELSHPGIVKHVAHGTWGEGELYLVMEWLEGEDLGHRLARGKLTITQSIQLIVQVSTALAVAHQRGLVHRDIKPSNLFLCDGRLDRVKLIDFGVVRSKKITNTSSRTGASVGTPGYMAPEQARGARDLDARADIFSLGCVFYECLTGEPPFVGEHVMAVLAKILLDDAPNVQAKNQQVPDIVALLVARMLSRDATKRPTDATALLSELNTIVDQLPKTERITEQSSRYRSSAWRIVSRQERRLVTVLLAGTPRNDQGSHSTQSFSLDRRDMERVQQVVTNAGAQLEWLADGAFAVVLTTSGAAMDQAARAARCALQLREYFTIPLAVATGRAVLSETLPLGEVVDRATTLLLKGNTELGIIRLDDVTAGLLDSRFDLSADAGGLVLRAEREVSNAARMLLGKPSPCMGRDGDIGFLESIFSECNNEPVARCALLLGPPGIGKSRVRFELVKRLQSRDTPILFISARGDPMAAGSSFGLMGQIVRQAAGIAYGEPALTMRQKLRARLLRHLDAEAAEYCTDFLGETSGAPAPPDTTANEALRNAIHDRTLLGDHVRKAWEMWLRAECDAQPVVMILEDLQWGDVASIKVVDHLLRQLEESPLFVLGVGRPEVHQVFPRLWAERGVREIRLAELSRKVCEKLIKTILGEKASEETSARIVERAAGNPFLLEELIRAVASGRGHDLPETVVASVQARLEALDSEARLVLRAASVFGQTAWSGGIAALVGNRVDVTEWLIYLVEREILTRRMESRFAGEIEVIFRQAVVRDVAYGSLPEQDRANGHRQAGRWLESRGEVDALSLVEHFEQGNDETSAVRWIVKAARAALEGNDLEGASKRAERGIRLHAEGENRAQLRVIQAEAALHKLDYTLAAQYAREAMDFLPEGSTLWVTALGLAAESYGRLCWTEQLCALTGLLLSIDRKEVPPAVEAKALGHCASMRILLGQEADAEIERLEALSNQHQDPLVQAWRARVLSIRAYLSGDLGVRLDLGREAVRWFEQAGDLRMKVREQNNLGDTLKELGQYPEAERILRELPPLCEQLGLHAWRSVTFQNLGIVLARTGRLEESVQWLKKALAVVQAAGEQLLISATRRYLAEAYMLLGEMTAAEIEARAAVNGAPSRTPRRASALAMLTEILVKKGAVDEALTCAHEAMDILENVGSGEGESRLRLAYAQAWAAKRQKDEAQAAIRQARDRLMKRAAQISNQRWRQSFMALPENTMTLQLARVWLDDP